MLSGTVEKKIGLTTREWAVIGQALARLTVSINTTYMQSYPFSGVCMSRHHSLWLLADFRTVNEEKLGSQQSARPLGE